MRALWLAACFVVATSGASALADDDLYRARTVVTGEDEPNRGIGVAQCFEDVLVKLSGDPRLIGDPAVNALGRTAESLVARYTYHDRLAGFPIHDEQGTHDRPFDLTVTFDQAKTDAALRALGREPWTAPRPRVVVLLGIRNGAVNFALAEDGDRGRDERESLAATAEKIAIPIVLPSKAMLAGASLDFDTLHAADAGALGAAAKAAGGDLALAGTLDWSDRDLGWIAEWSLDANGKTYRWQIRGVSFDDAFRNAIRGTAQILSGHGSPS